ncbi:protein-tyrosine-phosphatase [Cardiosporidium cionae]|uniref:Protein-tyrosine-phosphatase n=1 Tax=Cardiosporidium cionae TaxID=476202 RepID=A0ABQ7JEN4_9APIC|nr:protein-tyrosine-phosphatase [Cardiosporidium cionae]|eukprot:KAF8822344.1 protein-tyrosine-phosphatase [Cardiosporidium cionae]
MDLRSWANTLANRSQQLARDGLAYVNRQLDQSNQLPLSGKSSLFSNSFIDLSSFHTSSVRPSECNAIPFFGLLIRYSVYLPRGRTLEAELSEKDNGYLETYDPSGNSSFVKIGHSVLDHFADSTRGQRNRGAEEYCRNVFTISDIPSDQVIRLGMICSQFPIDGNFIFRFKMENPNEMFSGHMWIDISNPTTPVPLYRGQIHMKVLLIPSYVDIHAHQKNEGNEVLGIFGEEEMCEASVLVSPEVEGPSPSSLSLTAEHPVLETEQSPIQAFSDTESDWLSLDEEILEKKPTVLSSNPYPTRKEESTPMVPISSFVSVDVFAGEDDTRIYKAKPNTSFGTNGLTREELAQNREARKAERIANKLQLTQQKRTEEKSRLQTKLAVTDAVHDQLEKWSKHTGGGWKDIRSLLSSLTEARIFFKAWNLYFAIFYFIRCLFILVLWVDADWEPVSLSSLMVNVSQVKRFYRKAVLLCHPDKHQKAAAEQQLRAETIFQALNESFKISSL